MGGMIAWTTVSTGWCIFHRGVDRQQGEEKIMRKLLKTVLAIALAGTFSAAIPAGAASIFITNNSFEDPVLNPGTPPTICCNPGPITGWTIAGPGGAGLWDINNFPFTFWSVPAPDGNQIAFISSAPAPGSPGSISQVLGDSLLANSFYSLTGYVGHPGGFPALYTVELLAGGNVLSASPATTGSQGTFDQFTLTFDSTGSLYVGQPLEIRLSSSGAQTGFDYIGLNVVAIPEPEIYAMLAAGLGLMGFVARRRKQQLAAA